MSNADAKLSGVGFWVPGTLVRDDHPGYRVQPGAIGLLARLSNLSIHLAIARVPNHVTTLDEWLERNWFVWAGEPKSVAEACITAADCSHVPVGEWLWVVSEETEGAETRRWGAVFWRVSDTYETGGEQGRWSGSWQGLLRLVNAKSAIGQ